MNFQRKEKNRHNRIIREYEKPTVRELYSGKNIERSAGEKKGRKRMHREHDL